jgi:ubiquinone/menaquinone biosynthesis C-methylase UbiE
MAWYEKSFGEDYLVVYKHRDLEAAAREVQAMMNHLNVPKGARVLDLCCGMGRHALMLADLGYQVDALDLSETLLTKARELDQRQRIQWHEGDMRQLPFAPQQFDAVVNFFTSFGYFADDQQNRQVLLEIERVLKPGGVFLIDFFNAEVVTRDLVPYSERTVDGLKIVERRKVKEQMVYKRIEISETTAGDSQSRTYDEQVKMYRLSDFMSMCADTKLSIEKVYGDCNGKTYLEQQSPRLIMLGKKIGEKN